MRRTTKLALAAPAACAMLLASATGAMADESYTMKLTDTMGNKSGSTSTATLTIDGDNLTVDIKGKGFTPNSPHAQHFHGSFTEAKKFMCPGPDQDKDGDGQVNVEEGVPMYGDVVLSLTTEGDTSPKSGLAIERMPKADAQGNLSYRRTIALPAGAGAKLRNLHIVQHGLDANGNDKYDMEALGESSFAKSLGVHGIPEEATNPATCGMVSAASVGNPPSGGVDTGNGSTEGVEAAVPIGLGVVALGAAGRAWMVRRRTGDES